MRHRSTLFHGAPSSNYTHLSCEGFSWNGSIVNRCKIDARSRSVQSGLKIVSPKIDNGSNDGSNNLWTEPGITSIRKADGSHRIPKRDRIRQLDERDVIVVIDAGIATVLDRLLDFVLLRVGLASGVPIVLQYANG